MEERNPEDLRNYLEPTFYIDSDSPVVIDFAKTHARGETAREKAISLFRAVRDEILYDPYNIRLVPEEYKASVIIGKRKGYCVAKAIALAAAARASGIPSRVGFADVKNHLSTERLRKLMKTDVFVFHGYAELFLKGRWLKVTPTFNMSLCEKFGVRPLEFDGKSDCLFHEFDSRGTGTCNTCTTTGPLRMCLSRGSSTSSSGITRSSSPKTGPPSEATSPVKPQEKRTATVEIKAR